MTDVYNVGVNYYVTNMWLHRLVLMEEQNHLEQTLGELLKAVKTLKRFGIIYKFTPRSTFSAFLAETLFFQNWR